MARVYDLKTRRRIGVNRLEFLQLLSTLEKYIELLRPRRHKPDGLNNAINIIAEMKWNGMFNPHYRDEHTESLEELLDEIHAELEAR